MRDEVGVCFNWSVNLLRVSNYLTQKDGLRDGLAFDWRPVLMFLYSGQCTRVLW